jgi:hypothetical protein
MHSGNYRLQKVTDSEQWDLFIKKSEYGTIFQYSDFIEALEINHSRYFIYNKNELRAAIMTAENDLGTEAILDDFLIYGGIIFGASTHGQNYSQIHSEQFRISEFVSEALIKIYKNVEIVMSPKINDIRPFLWVNYHSDLNGYDVDVRYTSYLNISDFSHSNKIDDIQIYSQAAKTRRQEIRYANREGVVTSEEYDADSFISLYSNTMKRQSIDMDTKSLTRMRNIITRLHDSNLLKMYLSRTQDGQLGSIACFAIDHNRAYYLFGANDPKLRDFHTGTAVLWDAFYELNKAGIEEVDLEGVNSPKRGWFKLSFGGDIRPYYKLKYQVL